MKNAFSKLVILCFLGLLLVFGACADVSKEKLPLPPLSETQIALILADFLAAESATSSALPATRDSLQKLYYKQILEIHKVSIEEYEQSLQFYSVQDSGIHRIFDTADSLLGNENQPKKKNIER